MNYDPPSLASLYGKFGIDTEAGDFFPSVGSRDVSLPAALSRVRAAEAALDAARSAARAAARREGKKIANLFADGSFVPRSTAERWCDEARAEGHAAGYRFACSHYEGGGEFHHIAEAIARAHRAGRDIGASRGMSEVGKIQARILADRQPDLSSNAKLGAPSEPTALADAILKAGARAKSATDADPPRETNALAKAIIKAGRDRRRMDDRNA